MKYQFLRSFLAIIAFFAFAFISWSGATTSAQKGELTDNPKLASSGRFTGGGFYKPGADHDPRFGCWFAESVRN